MGRGLLHDGILELGEYVVCKSIVSNLFLKPPNTYNFHNTNLRESLSKYLWLAGGNTQKIVIL